MTQVDRRNLLKKLIKSGYQVSPDALDYFLSLDSPNLAVDSVIVACRQTECPSVLSRDFIENLLNNKDKESKTVPESVENHAAIDTPELRDSESVTEATWSIRILKSPDKDSVGSEGTVDDFLALFDDRYNRIKKIYAGRMDTRGALSPAAARNRRTDSKRYKELQRQGHRGRRPPSLVVIGIVRDKRTSQSGNIILDIEDSEGSIICVVPTSMKAQNGQKLAEKANAILLDEIVCVSGYVDQDGKMIADDVIFPDIPMVRESGRAQREVYAAFISDLHCGSNEFLEDEFDRFIRWLSGRDVDNSEKHMIERTEYLFIAGDLVDGIGVYPEQRGDLAIPSIYDQYALLASKLRDLPDRIKILCIPGNHDACRQALPRPPIPEEFASSLYDLGDQIIMLGDPCQVMVEGVNLMLTHGDSLDDLVTNIPSASYKKPAIPMKSLLEKRHLAPLFGGKTELAPLHRDWMVIDTPPDVVHFGHAHHNAVSIHRRVRIINSGTFQAQTDFMRKQGIVPTPGIVTFLNLSTGAPEVKLFYDMIGN
ncbi:MAG: DNA-directed DNA polymerase II small subunit [Candidatus Thorarchaeota archaeon]